MEERNHFTIDDGFQEAIQLESEHRDVIGATFSKYLLGNIGWSATQMFIRIPLLLPSICMFVCTYVGGSENFQSKRSFFFGELSKNASAHRRMVNIQVERSDLLHNVSKLRFVYACIVLYGSTLKAVIQYIHLLTCV